MLFIILTENELSLSSGCFYWLLVWVLCPILYNTCLFCAT